MIYYTQPRSHLYCLSYSVTLLIVFLGKGVSAGDKATLSQAKPTSLVPSRAQVKPFAGKVFYLDLPSNRIAETLERDIKELGGVRHLCLFSNMCFLLPGMYIKLQIIDT